MRLIDADKALSEVKPYEASDENWSVTGGTAIRLIHSTINNAPTVDAVPVVRCKDCRYFKMYKCRMGYSDHDDFCSYGEYTRNTEGIK